MSTAVQSVARLEATIADTLSQLLAARDDLRAFVKFLAQFGHVVVFGGFVRDAIHNSRHADQQKYRDLDLVVLGSFAEKNKAARNNFGGYRRLFSDGLKIDYWSLNETYAFRKGLVAPALANLPRTTVYTINACVFDPTQHRLYEHRAISDISSRIIGFNCTGYLNVFPVFQAFRALDFADRLDYCLSPDVHSFVKDILATTTFEEFCTKVWEHRPEIDEARLRTLYNRSDRW